MSSEKDTTKTSKSYKEWKEKLHAKDKERKTNFESISFRQQVELSTSESCTTANDQKLGYPGEYPYTRGIHPSMYRGRLWTMRQFAGFGSPQDTNKRFHYLLEHGQTGLSTAFDMPSLMGYDPDHPRSKGEVGREGVSVACLFDMQQLFEKIDLSKVSVSMTINCTATIAMAFYFALARQNGIAFDQLSGTIQNDMLKEFIAQKEWISPPAPSIKLACDLIEFCSTEATRFNPISISGYHIREAGATAVQELAFTLADGLAYVDHCIGRGLKIDDFAPRLSFFFDIHNDFFEEIAKLRAARRLWARLMRERYQAQNPRSLMLRTHAQTAGVSLTAQQPMNNIVRVTLQALAAVLGGVQSLHTNSMDETLSLPTEEAVRVALRTQQILAEESGIANVIDPLGGSFYLETLTDQIESEALALIEKIDQFGGMLNAVEQGFPQKEIAEASYQFQQKVDAGEYKIVGVNCYQEGVEQEIPTLEINQKLEEQRRSWMSNFKSSRDRAKLSKALEEVRVVCKAGSNVMPALIAAVEVGATLGEISEIYREVFGVYRDPGDL